MPFFMNKKSKRDKIDPIEKEDLVDDEHDVKEPEKKYDFILERGDSDKKVKLVQFAIGTKVDGIYGDQTQSKLDEFRKENGYNEFDYGDVISSTEYDRITSSIEDLRHIKLARSYVGEVEELDIDNDGDPDNRSPEIDKMTQYVFNWFNPTESEEGYPWCAIFISYVLHSAYPEWTYKSASVKEWLIAMENRINDKKVLEIYKKNELQKNKIYIGCWVNSSGFGHIFFVDPYKSILINDHRIMSTIEGNTNDGGSREGNGVYERQRYFTRNNKIRIFGIDI